MPFQSTAQQRWAHTATGTAALGGPAKVAEWDAATNFKKLPKRKSRVAGERIASAILSRRKSASTPGRHAAAVKSGNTPKGAR